MTNQDSLSGARNSIAAAWLRATALNKAKAEKVKLLGNELVGNIQEVGQSLLETDADFKENEPPVDEPMTRRYMNYCRGNLDYAAYYMREESHISRIKTTSMALFGNVFERACLESGIATEVAHDACEEVLEHLRKAWMAAALESLSLSEAIEKLAVEVFHQECYKRSEIADQDEGMTACSKELFQAWKRINDQAQASKIAGPLVSIAKLVEDLTAREFGVECWECAKTERAEKS